MKLEAWGGGQTRLAYRWTRPYTSFLQQCVLSPGLPSVIPLTPRMDLCLG